jgi:eukaryotic-like serine/threonine-protein kinase
MSVPLPGGGKLLGDRYEAKTWVGAGGMQNVFLAHDTYFARDVVLKTPKDESGHKRFENSASVSARVNQSNVAKTLDYFIENGRPYLVEEFVPGEDLGSTMSRGLPFLPPSTCARILHQLAKGLAASHHAGVVHRDIKPSNIMVVGDTRFSEVKITDFGIAKLAADEFSAWDGKGSTTSKTIIGAIPYMSPESITAFKNYDKPSDVWAIAAIVYELMSGNCPFGTGLLAIPAILAAVSPREPTQITASQFRPLGKDLYSILLSCFAKEPTLRPTADELVEKCGELCYSIESYEIGTISKNLAQSLGLIAADYGGDLMYHRDSFYGRYNRAIGTRLWYARHPGGGNDRAFPIVVLGRKKD